MSAPVLRPLTMGEVLDTAFGLYRSKFIVLLTIAAILQTLPGVFSIYLEVSGLSMTSPLLLLLSFFLDFLFGSFALAAATFVISGAYLDHQIGAAEAIAKAVPFLLPLALLSAMTSLVIGVGFLLLIVPGIIAVAGFALANAVLVIESPISPTNAMRRSWFLTKGERRKILSTIFVGSVMLLLPVIVVAFLAGILGALGAGLDWVVPAITLLFRIAIYPFIYGVIVVLYYDMRVRKEGLDLEMMAGGVESV